MLFPAVAVTTVRHQVAPLCVLTNECTRLPVLAHLRAVIVEEVGFSPEVLPVVCIQAETLIVFFVQGAPLRLEVKHVKVLVFGQRVEQPRLQVLVRVGKRTILAVVTNLAATVSRLVLFNVVESLNFVVRIGALFFSGAVASDLVLAQVWRVVSEAARVNA